MEQANGATKPKYHIPRIRKMMMVPCVWNAESQTSPNQKKLHGIASVPYYEYHNNGSICTIRFTEDWDRVGETIQEKIYSDGKYLPRIYEEQLEKGKELVKLSNKIIGKNLGEESVATLLKMHKELHDAWIAFDELNVPPWFFAGDQFQKRLHEETKKAAASTTDEEFTALVTSPTLSFSTEEELGILEAAKYIEEHDLNWAIKGSIDQARYKLPKEVTSKITALAEKYYWIPFGYDGPTVYDEEHYLQAIKEALAKGALKIKERISEIKRFERDTPKKQEKIIEKHGLSKKLAEQIKKTHTLALMTDQRKEFQFQSHVALDKVLSALAEKIGVEKIILKYVVLEEIENLKDKPKELKSLAEKRINGLFFTKTENGKREFIYGQKAQDMAKEMLSLGGEEAELKGTVASMGPKPKTIGPARIALTPKDASKIKEGEILVTNMTTPEYVPAMRKAAAIVTDEGGVTCHAAIVSRELNKPCIIATKNATISFKTGQVLEVDTKTGIVRAIKEEKALEMGLTKQQLLEFFENNKIDLQNAKASIFAADFVYSNYINSESVTGKEYSPTFVYHSGEANFYQLMPLNKVNSIAKAVFENIKNGNTSFEDFFGKSYKLEEEIDNDWKSVKDIDSLNYKDITELFEKIVSKGGEWWKYGIIGEDKGAVIEYEILPNNQKNRKITKVEAMQLVSILSHPKEQAIFTGERMLFYEMCKMTAGSNPLKKALENGNQKAFEHNKSFMKLFHDYYKEYFFAKTNFYDATPITVGAMLLDIKKAIKGKTTNYFEKEIKQMEKDRKNLLDKKASLLKKSKLTSEEKKLIDYSENLSIWLDHRKRAMMKQFYYLFVIQHELSKRTGSSYQKLADMTLAEMKEFLTKKGAFVAPDAEKRKGSTFCVYEKGLPTKFFYEKDAQELFETAKGKEYIGELKGSVACMAQGNGKVSGKARLVRDPSKDTFNDGEILITSMTRIEFVPLLKHAKAIVTNEGGVACHAAIVSRELKVPCITGTKNATSVINSGDEIELDTKTGVVRIISHDEESPAIKNNYKIVEGAETQKLVSKVKEIKWDYWLNRPYRPFSATVAWKGINEEYFARTGFKGMGANNYLYQESGIYCDKEFKKKGIKFFKEYFKKHKMKDITKNIASIHKSHLKKLQEITANNEMSIAQKTFEFAELIRDYMPFLWIIAPLEDYFDKRAAKLVPKYVTGDYSKFVGDISIPKKKNSYVLMQDELKKGAPLEEIRKKYGWMKSRDGFSDFYTIEDLQEIKKNYKEPEKHKVKIPKKLAPFTEELRELVFFRADRTDKYYEFWGATKPLLEDVSKSIKTSFAELADYDANSIIQGNPKKYSKNFCYVAIKNKYAILDQPILPELLKHDTTEIKGRTAFKGKASGIARIVTHSNDINKVKAGDILVAQMTFPSFIAAMQKAAAFVTDEGSITCHAAIIAREMKKPCIVGTKNATKILKDGDKIEVDADNGTVRKL